MTVAAGDRLPRSAVPIRVVVVDDHRTLAELLARALDAEPGLQCVAHAATIADAVATVRQERPDVVLMDLWLPDGDGIEAAATLLGEDPDLKVFILTGHPTPQDMVRAAAHGAAGFLAKDGSVEEVLSALRTPGDAGLVLPTSAGAHFHGERTAPPPRPVRDDGGLTPRETDVLRRLAEGKDARSIARELGISVGTCRTHVKRVLAKLGAHSQLEAVVRAARIGLLDHPDGPGSR